MNITTITITGILATLASQNTVCHQTCRILADYHSTTTNDVCWPSPEIPLSFLPTCKQTPQSNRWPQHPINGSLSSLAKYRAESDPYTNIGPSLTHIQIESCLASISCASLHAPPAMRCCCLALYYMHSNFYAPHISVVSKAKHSISGPKAKSAPS